MLLVIVVVVVVVVVAAGDSSDSSSISSGGRSSGGGCDSSSGVYFCRDNRYNYSRNNLLLRIVSVVAIWWMINIWHCDRDFFLTPEQAVDYGLIDEVVKTKTSHIKIPPMSLAL